LLLKAPVEWWYGQGERKNRYILAPCDMDMELRFQTRHEQWAFNRMMALREFSSADNFHRIEDTFLERQAGNEYAFGTPCSLKWLFTEFGLFEYILLKFQMGQAKYGSTPIKPDELSWIKNNDKESWADLTLRVLKNDFPVSEGNGQAPPMSGETITETGSSPFLATVVPTPSTAESTPSSVVPPGV
jgi:hypothetical protein